MTQNTKTQKNAKKKQTRGFVQNWKINKNVNIFAVFFITFEAILIKNQVKMDRASR